MPIKNSVRIEHDPLAGTPLVWQFEAGSYQWIRARLIAHEPMVRGVGCGPADDEEDFLVTKAKKCESQLYVPASNPELFRTFAKTKLSKDAILEFADRFGMLGVAHPLRIPSQPTKAERAAFKDRGYRGESESVWRAEILDLRISIQLWNACALSDDEAIKQSVCSKKEFPIADRHRFAKALKESDLYDDWVVLLRNDESQIEKVIASLCPSQKQSRREKALSVVHANVNQRLRVHCSPLLAARASRELQFTIRVVPKNLLGTIWWQFARSVMGEATFSTCKICTKVIEHSSGDHGFRSDRQFCSDPCKFKDHRAKVKTAKALEAEGRKLPEIADILGTSVSAVRNWIRKSK